MYTLHVHVISFSTHSLNRQKHISSCIRVASSKATVIKDERRIVLEARAAGSLPEPSATPRRRRLCHRRVGSGTSISPPLPAVAEASEEDEDATKEECDHRC